MHYGVWIFLTLLATALINFAAEIKPGLTDLNPRGVQRGDRIQIKLAGSNLVALTAVKFTNTNLTGTVISAATNAAEIEVHAAASLARGTYEFSVADTNGESGKLKLYVDDVPQVFVRETNPPPRTVQQPEKLPRLPVSIWGALEKPGDGDAFEFEAGTGETLVLDLSAKSVGSKIASGEIVVLDAVGRVVAENSGFDGGDPLLAFRPAKAGRFTVRVSDRMAAGSKDHFYRLTIGALPYVTGVFPLGVSAKATSTVQLIGHNLQPRRSRGHDAPSDPSTLTSVTTVYVKAGAPGDVDVPVDADVFRSRRSFKVIASAAPELAEFEPNDMTPIANEIQIPGAVNGRMFTANGQADADSFRFRAEVGRRLIVETQAAQRGSPVDTKIEILDASGRPVPRLQLQAVRDSAINFRAIDSNQQGARLDNWEEMDLNNYIYFNGDVARLFRMPQGPDSDLLFYPAAGKRRAYFDGTATGHALEEPCYVVEPRALDEQLVANGLPVFTVFHANDDDGERKLGADSKLYFTPSATGDYLVRVTDARGFSGDRFAYRLVVRDAKPDFNVTLNGANPTVPRGSGQSFSATVSRLDGFEGEIRVDITHLPSGFIVSNPLVIEAGHSTAHGTVFALTNAASTTNANIKLTATAIVDGKTVTKDISSLGQIKVADAPKLFVHFEPFTSASETNIVEAPEDKPFEITLSPGQMIPAWLKIRRNGHKELVTFQIENLPFGVIVDNIGLNGVLIPKDDNDREIYLTCARWVGDMERLCYAIEQNAGRQTSRPLILKVRKPAQAAAK
ncbi:MAG TPA: hypothetical protein VNT99_04730 [Methylomirabilota bacterium]|nr:hypothetical protein [Methylomirabilota bacterium]